MTIIVLVMVYFLSDRGDEVSEAVAPEVVNTIKTEKDKVTLDIAFMSEAPDGNWTHPWSNACEETVTLMVDKYYTGQSTIGISEAKSYLVDLFGKEEALFGTNRNADASQMLEIISRYTGFHGEIVRNPTLEDIKREIKEGRPVITLHRGFDLHNPNIEFSPTLSSYHTIVIIGYDDNRKMFITHDPGDEVDGEGHKYSYSVVMNSMHDYNIADNKADGAPTAIFTSPK